MTPLVPRPALALLLAGLAAAAASLLGGGALASPAAAATKTLGDGGWSWFADPRAVYHEGRFRRTYVGWVDRSGAARVASYDHDSGAFVEKVLRSDLGVDDHNNPALLVRPDGRLQAFFSTHSGPRMYYRVSTRPEDVSDWGPTRTLRSNVGERYGYTYPNPIRLSGEGNRYWLFWRGGDNQPTFARSLDGQSWAAARTFIRGPDGHRPYVKFASDGRRTIHVAFTEAHPRNLRTSIYYARYRRGAVSRADGRRIEAVSELPLEPRQADRVYDGSAGPRAWIHDVAADREGRPAVVYATVESADDHRYRYAVWTGRRWKDTEITRAGGTIAAYGEPHYSGGITLDHDDPRVVYLSKRVGSFWEVQRRTTSDRGETWTTDWVTRSSSTDNLRPVSPRGFGAGDLSVLWMRGSYDYWTEYGTSVVGRLARPTAPPELATAALPPPSP